MWPMVIVQCENSFGSSEMKWKNYCTKLEYFSLELCPNSRLGKFRHIKSIALSTNSSSTVELVDNTYTTVSDLCLCLCISIASLAWYLLWPAVCPPQQQQQPFNGRLSGTTRVGQYQKKHSPAHTHLVQRTSFITFLHLQRSTASSFSAYVLDCPLEQPLSGSFLVFRLVLNPQLHTPCISSPNHHHLFAAHAHTNADCSAAISMLCHLHLVSLLAAYLGVCLLA